MPAQASDTQQNGGKVSVEDDASLVYDSFEPLVLQQNADLETLSFPTFDAALDEFYAKVKLLAPSSGIHLSAQATFICGMSLRRLERQKASS